MAAPQHCAAAGVCLRFAMDGLRSAIHKWLLSWHLENHHAQ
jgi:hypothetical protein